MTHTQKGLTTVQIAIAVAVLVLLGTGAYFKLRQMPGAELSPTGTLAAIPSEWEDYASASMGFDIRYPKDWNVDDDCNGLVAFGPGPLPLIICYSDAPPAGYVLIGRSPADPVTIAEYETILRTGLSDVVRTEITLDGQKAVMLRGLTVPNEVHGDALAGRVAIFTLVSNGKTIYMLSYFTVEKDNDYSAIYSQMLSTFKFTK